MRRLVLLGVAAVLVLAGCGSPSQSALVCQAFAADGPIRAVENAFMAARGDYPDQYGEDWMGPARDAVTGLRALAERVSGDVREDLLVFARDVEAGSRGVVVYLPSGAVDPAGGPAFEMYLAWNTFLHEYGPGCGFDLGL
jgi:hypothetical protein